MLESVYGSNKIEIHTLIVGSDEAKSRLLLKYDIPNILSVESIYEFYKACDIKLDYSIIDEFKSTQTKVENFLHRVSSDINTIQYIYYSALSYWIKEFENNNIDAVMYLGLEFGSVYDSVIFDVAKYFKKKVYIIEYGLFTGKVFANQLLDYINNDYIKISSKTNNLRLVNKNIFLYNSKDEDPIKRPKNLKDYLKKTPEKYGGYLLIMFISLILGKYKSVHHSFNISWWQYFKNYLYSKKLFRYYQSKSIKFDKSKRYIFYAMHMEPEAGTLARTTFSNQLVIIKSLAQNLPEGWVLYVKEHPHQLTQFNNFYRYYYLSSLHKFKTINYYDEILKLKNVFLLDIHTNSKDIIENSSAVSTINGTVILEAISVKKPVLAFSQATTPFVKETDIFDIKTTSELEEAIGKINNGFIPEYKNIDDVFHSYYYEVNMGEEVNYRNLIESLVCEEGVLGNVIKN